MKVITISREYGAGGHTVGRKLAEILGVELYDKDIIASTSKQVGIATKQVEEAEEEITRTDTFVRSISPISYDQKDAIFEAEKQFIIDVAKKGPCIILGRGADKILEEAGIDSFDVFIYASDEAREKRVGELIGSNNISEIRKAIKRHDHARKSFYNYYTDRQLGDYRNYNLMIDSSMIGYEKSAEVIAAAVRNAE